MGLFMSRLLRGALDRAHDALVGAAAADVRAHVLDDLGARRLGLLLEQIGRAHDLAGLAVAALRHPLGEPGLLHRMAGVGGQALDGGHRLAGDLRHLRLAGEGALAVDVHHAGAAQPGAAAELGAGELEILADHPQQWGGRRRVSRRRLAVHNEVRGHCFLPEPARSQGAFAGLSNHSAKAGQLQWPAVRKEPGGLPPTCHFSLAHRERLPTFRPALNAKAGLWTVSSSSRLIRKTSRLSPRTFKTPWSRPRTSAGVRRKSGW